MHYHLLDDHLRISGNSKSSLLAQTNSGVGRILKLCVFLYSKYAYCEFSM